MQTQRLLFHPFQTRGTTRVRAGPQQTWDGMGWEQEEIVLVQSADLFCLFLPKRSCRREDGRVRGPETEFAASGHSLTAQAGLDSCPSAALPAGCSGELSAVATGHRLSERSLTCVGLLLSEAH